MTADRRPPPQQPAGPPASDQPGEATVRVQQLFVRYQSQLRSFVLALTGDFGVTDDIVQEVFLTITAKASSFRPDASFRHWMLAIARLKVLESRRAARRFSPRVIESLAAALEPEKLAEDRLGPLLDCLDQLPPKMQELIRLRYFSQHGPTDLAAMLGRSISGVNTTLTKARDLLRECVDRKLADGAGAAS
jgi:RNA polymerase sigma-70 factor (ECF subfamily)